MSDYKLVGAFKKDLERRQFIGVITKVEPDGALTIVSVGLELSEFAVLEWIRSTIKLMREAGSTDVQAPDMIDRGR